MQIQDNTSSENSIEIKGKAMHARSLSINGRAILMDPDGKQMKLYLLVGINKITLGRQLMFEVKLIPNKWL